MSQVDGSLKNLRPFLFSRKRFRVQGSEVGFDVKPELTLSALRDKLVITELPAIE